MKHELNFNNETILRMLIREMLYEACWKSHKQVGFKMKGKGAKRRRVPNCVPRNEADLYEADADEAKKKKLDKDKMKCNKPQRAAAGSPKKKTVKACQDGKEKIIHYGHRGMQHFSQHKDPKRRKSFRARHKCDLQSTKNNKLSARHWACKDLW